MCSTFRHGFDSPKSRLYTSKAKWEQKAANIPQKSFECPSRSMKNRFLQTTSRNDKKVA